MSDTCTKYLAWHSIDDILAIIKRDTGVTIELTTAEKTINKKKRFRTQINIKTQNGLREVGEPILDELAVKDHLKTIYDLLNYKFIIIHEVALNV